MIKIFIDEVPVEAQDGMTILQAAKKSGIHIPHFCYHSAFAPEGTCRMCLVDIEDLPKLELACSTRVREGMRVSTKSEKVVVARKGVLEFLLADHPLDCPICDKAGECKLQDYFEEFGFFDSRFSERKEKRQKKVKIGKTLIHDQERCILCRRCVRFLREVTKTQELGVFERGIRTEINIYDGLEVNNHYSGNLAQFCPVGAITDADFRFKTRSWFLREGKSICPLCSRGCNISIEHLTGFHRFPVPKRIFRVKARENHEVNGFWICDIGRYGYSYLYEGRIEQIVSNNGKNKENLVWERVIAQLAEKIKKLNYMNKTSHIVLVLNTWLTNEDLFLIKKLFIDDLKVERIFFADSPEGEADDLLLTSDRSPNKRGAQELGFELRHFNSEALAARADLLLIFAFPVFDSDLPNTAELKAALDKIETKLLLASHMSELNSLVDTILPLSLIAEKGGSLTNVDGKVQIFSPALEAPGESLPAWEFLSRLAEKIGINSEYYRQFSSPETILPAMAKEIPLFEKKSE